MNNNKTFLKSAVNCLNALLYAIVSIAQWNIKDFYYERTKWAETKVVLGESEIPGKGKV